MKLTKDIPYIIVLNGCCIYVYKNSLIFKDENGKSIGELEWKDIYRLAEQELL